VVAFLGGYPRRVKGIPGVDWRGLNLDIKEGGNTIEYRDEDPYIRKMFQPPTTTTGMLSFRMSQSARFMCAVHHEGDEEHEGA